MSENSGTLIIKTFTADEAIPISDAAIRVQGSEASNQRVIYLVETDKSGLSERLYLPAPNISYSLSPGRGIEPYSKYDVTVKKDGYYTKTIKDVPIFSGIGAVLPINMIPITSSPVSQLENNAIITENDKL